MLPVCGIIYDCRHPVQSAIYDCNRSLYEVLFMIVNIAYMQYYSQATEK